VRKHNEERRRQEQLEKEPVKLEDETALDSNNENQDFSSLIYSTPPIPRQHPPKPPSRLHMEEMLQNTFKCLECGDDFLFEKSLQHHYDRKSIMIEINCIICKGKLVFYNKCQLLRHAREHTQNNQPMKFINPKITPLTMKMCLPRSKAPDTNSKYSKSCSECDAVFATRIGLQEHMQRKTDVHACDACNMTLPNQ
jgi:hypothetical protein